MLAFFLLRLFEILKPDYGVVSAPECAPDTKIKGRGRSVGCGENRIGHSPQRPKSRYGPELPAHFMRFAQFEGRWEPPWLERLVENARRYWIRIDFKYLPPLHGGFATLGRLKPGEKMRIAINDSFSAPSRFGVLCHEMAHILLGHLGSDKDHWWPSRSHLGRHSIEIEAEATAYIVTRHLGLEGTSATYVSGYLGAQGEVPKGVSFDMIAKVAGQVEKMALRVLPAPRVKPDDAHGKGSTAPEKISPVKRVREPGGEPPAPASDEDIDNAIEEAISQQEGEPSAESAGIGETAAPSSGEPALVTDAELEQAFNEGLGLAPGSSKEPRNPGAAVSADKEIVEAEAAIMAEILGATLKEASAPPIETQTGLPDAQVASLEEAEHELAELFGGVEKKEPDPSDVRTKPESDEGQVT
jgi:hypothetical protein